MSAGRCVASIILAIVKVFPVPVAPSKTWFFSPLFKPSTNSTIALGWSPAGLKSDTTLKSFFSIVNSFISPKLYIE